MKKRISLFLLSCCLCISAVKVEAKEAVGYEKYVNLILDEVKKNKSDTSLISLGDSLEDIIQSIKPEDANKILNFVEEKIEDGSWETEKGIEKAIEEGEEKFGVTLTKEQKEMIYSIVKKVKNLGIDPMFLITQAEKIYDKYSDELKSQASEAGKKIVEETQEKIKEEIKKSVTNYFSDMVTNVTSFIKGIFNR
ncbi:MAG: DUF1002 domain-containing protein [Lachnospiraceae bacterium]|nr:DUF1002 domain-containing protein [Lachnospiraceae bacterium]